LLIKPIRHLPSFSFPSTSRPFGLVRIILYACFNRVQKSLELGLVFGGSRRGEREELEVRLQVLESGCIGKSVCQPRDQ
jgi:hypothetical protein